MSRTAWSQATHTSPESSGSCMKAYVTDCGFAVAHTCLTQFHMVAASGEAKVVFTPPVKLG